MYVTKSINANHEDLIHDVAYDFYGKRMATCSSDQKVKVWDQQENGEWVCSARCTTVYNTSLKLNLHMHSSKVTHESTAPGSNDFSTLIDACRNVCSCLLLPLLQYQGSIGAYTHILQLEVSLWLCMESELGPSGVWTGTERREGEAMR